MTTIPTRAEVCVVAVAECFRGDGEILANPIGTIPMIGGRLARAAFEPDLLMTDGEALLIANAMPVGVAPTRKVVEALEPVPLDVRRRVVGPAPRDDGRHPGRPLRQPEHRLHRRTRSPRRSCSASGARPATPSTTRRSYWVPNHSPQVFVRAGRRRLAASATTGRPSSAPTRPASTRSARVVTNLGVFDFETPDHRMRLRSVHPGVTVDDVVAATGFELAVPDDVPETPAAHRRRAAPHPRGDRPRRRAGTRGQG